MFETILICGSRTWGATDDALQNMRDVTLFESAMSMWLDKHGAPALVVAGGARGADTFGELWAKRRAKAVRVFPADWKRFGRSAGPKRNQQMLDEGRPQAVIAFTRDLRTSRGTRDMVTRARKAGLPVWLPVPGSDDPSAK